MFKLMALTSIVTFSFLNQTQEPAIEKGEALYTKVNSYPSKDIDGNQSDFAAKTKGKVVLIVNVASECGYTPQYEGLQKLHEKFKDKGVVILGVPSNEFGGQEPGSNKAIREFCTSRYKVTFDLLEKTSVKGKEKCPLYQSLTSKEANPITAGEVKWNFTKFLVDRAGKVVGRFEPNIDPLDDQMVKAIEKVLETK